MGRDVRWVELRWAGTSGVFDHLRLSTVDTPLQSCREITCRSHARHMIHTHVLYTHRSKLVYRLTQSVLYSKGIRCTNDT